MDKLSPKFRTDLEHQIKEKLFDTYKSYESVESYLQKWHEEEYDAYNSSENFYFIKFENGKLNAIKTLAGMGDELVLKVAIDLGIDTPDIIPSIPIFRNELKTNYETASTTFERAFKECEEHPDTAIGLANSALESIIKEILKDERLIKNPKGNKTLYGLASELLKEFRMFPNSDIPEEISTIGSSLLSVSQHIEKIRSEKTSVHGKTNDDYIIEDPLYAYFIINCVTTVGLFLQSFYKKKYPKEMQGTEEDDTLPF